MPGDSARFNRREHGQRSSPPQDSDWGEEECTRFPTAMLSYASDAQRSDAATVCSGSGVEDIEVESVMSQEDEQKPAALVAHRKAGGATDATTPQHGGVAASAASAAAAASRAVEFAEEAHSHTNNAPTPSSNRHFSIHSSSMGPPLNRTLLLSRDHSRPSSVKSFGSNTSEMNVGDTDDVESNHSSQEGESTAHHTLRPQKDLASVIQHTNTKQGSVKSFGSNGADDTDDCGGSLDVETHSVGARSIHSQEDDHAMGGTHRQVDEPVEIVGGCSDGGGADGGGTRSNNDNAGIAPARGEARSFKPDNDDDEHTTLPKMIPNGRRSPGGTIYKGRGNRHYKGRYMHLPLKRFHQNGIHLGDNDDEEEEEPKKQAASGSSGRGNNNQQYPAGTTSSSNTNVHSGIHAALANETTEWKELAHFESTPTAAASNPLRRNDGTSPHQEPQHWEEQPPRTNETRLDWKDPRREDGDRRARRTSNEYDRQHHHAHRATTDTRARSRSRSRSRSQSPAADDEQKPKAREKCLDGGPRQQS